MRIMSEFIKRYIANDAGGDTVDKDAQLTAVIKRPGETMIIIVYFQFLI